MKSKGLSSVMGAVLLVTISVGAAASAWTFINTVSEDARENIGDRLNDKELERKSELSVQNVYNSTDRYSIAVLENTGSVALELRNSDKGKLLSQYIDGRPESWKFLKSQTNPVILEAKTEIQINTTRKFPQKGKSYNIKLTGPHETSTTYICYNSGDASC